MSTAERWARVQTLFHAALERAPDERAGYLTDATAGDDALRDEVQSLLAAHEAPGVLGHLDTAPADTDEPGLEWIGPWQLIRRLGEGGMGVVHLARRQTHGFTQTVALKLIRAGLADRRLEQRLAEERRILAGLDHPGIARLIDGGATPAGQPWYAMEYIEGSTILQYCDDHAVPLRRRLRLFVLVCDAIHYAHQQLIVHQDVKPANIFVTLDGRPKLLDFGVAKVLERGSGADATQTAPWMTPAYASPEQLLDGRVSTLTDVYALGVILYELLAGCRPYDVDGLSPMRLAQVVAEEIPPLPSQAARAGTALGLSTRRLRRQLSGDLDAITMKALAKDPARRYCSAAELADDLRRYLDGMPIMARPDSLAYRAATFVRRHAPGVAAAAAVVVFLVGGLGIALWQARDARDARARAERALHESQDLSAFLLRLFEASDPFESVDTVAARALLRRGVAEAERLTGQPTVQARMFDALGQIDAKLGRYDEAERLLRGAVNLRRDALGPDHPDVAVSIDHLADLARRVGRYAEAESLLTTSLAIKERALGPDDPQVAETLKLLGFLMPYVGRTARSEDYYRRAAAIQRRAWGPDDPERAKTLIPLASILAGLVKVEPAESAYREAVELQRRAYGADDPRTADAQVHLADFLERHRHRPEDAERLLREAIGVIRRGRGPRNLTLVHGISSLAEIAEAQGRSGEAEALLQEALEIRLAALGPDHPAIAEGLAALSNLLFRLQRFDEAEALKRRELALWQRTLGPDHGTVAASEAALANILAARGRYAEADRLYRASIALRERVSGPLHGHLIIMLTDHAAMLVRQRRFAEAEAQLARAESIADATTPRDHPDVVAMRRRFVGLYEAWGRPERAAPYRD